MSRFDLTNVNFVDLIELREEVEASIDARKKEEKQQLLQDIRRMVSEKGFSMGEIFNEPELIKKSPVVPKYQNPDNPDQKWSGRGRQPHWIAAHLEQGKTLEDLLIDKPDTPED
uniref:DNA-binding protein H-NS n=1 Tax=Candidatus Kentrum eta TaxID=2126337 RepID=A0A450U953_9GAMM|nr:MAG: DNA-binding protein H-NS [Candidatus Kentron sp. H]VFJ90490.1 MAG: DNA-binding protein H-NS [Candidatus Kentron sp. H]VFJ96666.1 MAG: DNA-binding protein H-NS [Candidatus Kentron sp. H]